MTTETLRVSEPRDVLSLVPFQLGFTPTGSLVLISLRGPRKRIGLVMRVDLPERRHLEQLADQMVSHLVEDDARSCIVAVYSDDDSPRNGYPSELVDVLETGLEAAGVGLEDGWHVGRDRCVCLTCEDSCCPPEGFAVTELQSSRLSAEMTYRGFSVAASRSDVAGDFDPLDDARLAEVADSAARHVAPAGDGACSDAVVRWRRRALQVWRGEVADRVRGDVAATTQVGTQEAGLLIAAMEDLAVRDALMLTCVPGSADEPERFVAAPTSTPGADRLFSQVFGSRGTVRPDPEMTRVASEVLRSLARQATGAAAARPLALLGWLAWWAGEWVLAHESVDRALRADPEHGLAGLLDQSMLAGIPPGWARRDRRADARGRDRV